MRIIHHLSAKTLIIVSLSMLIGGLLALSLQFAPARIAAAPVAYAGSALHPFTIASHDFHDGGRLATTFELNQDGCTGKNLSPELHWENTPAGTQSFALLVVDYDAPLAGGWHHWVVYNIPASVHELARGSDQAYTEGLNDFGFVGYGGPCPPATGETHHYLFLLYATDLANIGASGQTYSQVLTAIQNDVLSATSIIGTFTLP
jgi:Raf kinase inhibitor-like YbhB/YbcL family protein